MRPRRLSWRALGRFGPSLVPSWSPARPSPLQIEAAQPLRLQREEKAVPMTFARVDLDAHERDRVLGGVHEVMQVSTEIGLHNVFVVPVPNDVAGASLDRLR